MRLQCRPCCSAGMLLQQLLAVWNTAETLTQLCAPASLAKAQPGCAELHGDTGLLYLYMGVCGINTTLYSAHKMLCFCCMLLA